MASGSKSSRAALRYARAIFATVEVDKPRQESLLVGLGQFLSLLQFNDTVFNAFTNPAYSAIKRLELIEDFIQKLNLNAEVRRVLLVIAKADRLSLLEDIVDRIKHLRLKASNLVSVTIETPVDLNAEERKRVVSRFGVVLGKPIEPTFVVDKNLVGGFKATANGKTYDGSVSGWLNNFQEKRGT